VRRNTIACRGSRGGAVGSNSPQPQGFTRAIGGPYRNLGLYHLRIARDWMGGLPPAVPRRRGGPGSPPGRSASKIRARPAAAPPLRQPWARPCPRRLDRGRMARSLPLPRALRSVQATPLVPIRSGLCVRSAANRCPEPSCGERGQHPQSAGLCPTEALATREFKR